jgi:hypothetical protein
MAVDISEKNGPLHALFEVGIGRRDQRQPAHRWVASRNGKKFLAVTPLEQKTFNGFYIVVNWPSLLK